jgi:FtsH-binding integral membrane protein
MSVEEAHHDDGYNKEECGGISDRLGFIRKVYGILSCQLLFTSCFSLFAMSSDTFKPILLNPIVLFGVLVCYFASICALVCCKMDKKVPVNYIMLSIFTLCVSWIVATTTVRTDPHLVIEAAFLTSAVVVGITVYAVTTKSDYTTFGPLLFCLLLVFITAGILCCFFPATLRLLYACLGVILFSFYLMVDTQMIVGGKHRKYEIDEDSYILAAVALYLDIINLFLYILEVMRG